LCLPFLVSACLVLFLGGPVVRALAAAKARQPVSADAPVAHQQKNNTPTMGGLLIIGPRSWQRSSSPCLPRATRLRGAAWPRAATAWFACLAVAGTFLLAGGIGLLDDLGKVRKKQNKAGLSERAKLALQIIVAAGFMLVLARDDQPATSAITAFGREINLGVWYYVLGVLYICGFGNAANFTDGLDGLLSA
jgi:phospho-N-acetylmuramoyl-pentapeptide-transferase